MVRATNQRLSSPLLSCEGSLVVVIIIIIVVVLILSLCGRLLLLLLLVVSSSLLFEIVTLPHCLFVTFVVVAVAATHLGVS